MTDTVNNNSWKCHGAFIIFNHEESYRRCLNDYSTFKGLVQPAALRFKYVLHITVITTYVMA
jgi:hypothetical protein